MSVHTLKLTLYMIDNVTMDCYGVADPAQPSSVREKSQYYLPLIFFSRILSMTGSMYSSTSLNRNGKPYLMAISSCFRKSGSLKFDIFRLFGSSFFLIQLMACCWGSIHSGNLLAFVVRIPFCTDSSSGGRPSLVHLNKHHTCFYLVTFTISWLFHITRDLKFYLKYYSTEEDEHSYISVLYVIRYPNSTETGEHKWALQSTSKALTRSSLIA